MVMVALPKKAARRLARATAPEPFESAAVIAPKTAVSIAGSDADDFSRSASCSSSIRVLSIDNPHLASQPPAWHKACYGNEAIVMEHLLSFLLWPAKLWDAAAVRRVEAERHRQYLIKKGVCTICEDEEPLEGDELCPYCFAATKASP